MAQIFKDTDGTIKEVVESRVVTRDELEAKLAEAQETLNDFNQLDAPALDQGSTSVTSEDSTPVDQPEVPAVSVQEPVQVDQVVVADVVVVEQPQQAVAAPAAPADPQPDQPTPVEQPQVVPAVDQTVAPAPQIIPVQG